MDGFMPVRADEKSKLELDLWRVWLFCVLFG